MNTSALLAFVNHESGEDEERGRKDDGKHTGAPNSCSVLTTHIGPSRKKDDDEPGPEKACYTAGNR